LSRLAPLVVLCSTAEVWHHGRPLGLEPSKPLELLLWLAMVPALPNGAGSLRERLLAELWRPNDGDRSDRKAGRAWLRSVCRRLVAQLARASRVSDRVFEGLVLVDETTGTVALDPRLAISDVQAFVAAARRAATASGAEQIAAAEKAPELGVRQLCPSDLPEPVTDRGGRSVPIFAWLQQIEWEQDAPAELRRLWRDTAL